MKDKKARARADEALKASDNLNDRVGEIHREQEAENDLLHGAVRALSLRINELGREGTQVAFQPVEPEPVEFHVEITALHGVEYGEEQGRDLSEALQVYADFGRSVTFIYDHPTRGEEPRLVTPTELRANCVQTYDHVRKAPRQFCLDRISNLRASDYEWEVPA